LYKSILYLKKKLNINYKNIMFFIFYFYNYCQLDFKQLKIRRTNHVTPANCILKYYMRKSLTF